LEIQGLFNLSMDGGMGVKH